MHFTLEFCKEIRGWFVRDVSLLSRCFKYNKKEIHCSGNPLKLIRESGGNLTFKGDVLLWQIDLPDYEFPTVHDL